RKSGPSPAPSPRVRASGGSSSAVGPRKTPKLAARGSQPRPGGGSVHASPALLPRISPSISPMIRHPSSSHTHGNSHGGHSHSGSHGGGGGGGGGAVNVAMSEDTALLLASKSNYQNLLEGNHLPGVSYPEELSTGLTSKRTSHK